MKQEIFYFACDLVDTPEAIEKYKEYHQKVWPEIKQSITAAGIEDMQIYITGNRLFMLMVVNEFFSMAEKSRMDAANATVQRWETLMGRLQQPLPWAEGQKWVQMERIFKL